jgi:hypothetical protein
LSLPFRERLGLHVLNPSVYLLNAIAAGIVAYLAFRASDRRHNEARQCPGPAGMAAIAMAATMTTSVIRLDCTITVSTGILTDSPHTIQSSTLV